MTASRAAKRPAKLSAGRALDSQYTISSGVNTRWRIVGWRASARSIRAISQISTPRPTISTGERLAAGVGPGRLGLRPGRLPARPRQLRPRFAGTFERPRKVVERRRRRGVPARPADGPRDQRDGEQQPDPD